MDPRTRRWVVPLALLVFVAVVVLAAVSRPAECSGAARQAAGVPRVLPVGVEWLRTLDWLRLTRDAWLRRHQA